MKVINETIIFLWNLTWDTTPKGQKRSFQASPKELINTNPCYDADGFVVWYHVPHFGF